MAGNTLVYRVTVIAVNTGLTLPNFESDSYLVETVIFSPDSSIIARDSGFGTLNVRTIDNDRTVFNISHRGVTAAAFSSNQKYLSTTRTGSIQIETLATQPRLQSQSQSTRKAKSIFWVKCAPDSMTVAVGLDQGDIEMWDPLTAKCIRTLRVHTYTVHVHSFSDDSEILASCCGFQLRLWIAKTGQCVHLSTVEPQWYLNLQRRFHVEWPILRLVKRIPGISSHIKSEFLEEFGVYQSYNLLDG
ncbi:WD repeat-containing protein [Paramyrothecium foliicola]|nr:WD repeat-containing protein [Paramyrothecium foliicola]